MFSRRPVRLDSLQSPSNVGPERDSRTSEVAPTAPEESATGPGPDRDFGRVTVFPLAARNPIGDRSAPASTVSVPTMGPEMEGDDQPDAGVMDASSGASGVAAPAEPVDAGSYSSPRDAGAAGTTASSPRDAGAAGGAAGTPAGGTGPLAPVIPFGQPLSMTAVTSGAFRGGLTMADYYPDLVGAGHWEHGGTAGPWDTGTRVGANAQLIGLIRIPARPDMFSVAQTVKYDKKVRDGVHDPNEGKTLDDLAKSHRDIAHPPFRQEFMGTGGWAISTADPPNATYHGTSNLELDRSFVTSLVGPGGRQDVRWSTSIRIVNGVVTRNTIS